MTSDDQRPRATIVMATYNGISYLSDQLGSIWPQLDIDDELLIVDDGSTDGTREYLSTLDDPRLRVLLNERNLGHVATFARGMAAARGKAILLSDQDDIWSEDHVAVLMKGLATHSVVASGLRPFWNDDPSVTGRTRAPAVHRPGRDFLAVMRGRQPYFGCAMGLRRDVTRVLLPMPEYVEAHDIWLAMVGQALGGVGQLSSPTVMRRIHSTNLTNSNRPIGAKLMTRVGMIRMKLAATSRVRADRRRIGMSPPAGEGPCP